MKGGKVYIPMVLLKWDVYVSHLFLKVLRQLKPPINIIEAFSKVREISRTIKAIPNTPQSSPKYQELMQKTGELISDLVVQMIWKLRNLKQLLRLIWQCIFRRS